MFDSIVALNNLQGIAYSGIFNFISRLHSIYVVDVLVIRLLTIKRVLLITDYPIQVADGKVPEMWQNPGKVVFGFIGNGLILYRLLGISAPLQISVIKGERNIIRNPTKSIFPDEGEFTLTKNGYLSINKLDSEMFGKDSFAIFNKKYIDLFGKFASFNQNNEVNGVFQAKLPIGIVYPLILADKIFNGDGTVEGGGFTQMSFSKLGLGEFYKRMIVDPKYIYEVAGNSFASKKKDDFDDLAKTRLQYASQRSQLIRDLNYYGITRVLHEYNLFAYDIYLELIYSFYDDKYQLQMNYGELDITEKFINASAKFQSDLRDIIKSNLAPNNNMYVNRSDTVIGQNDYLKSPLETQYRKYFSKPLNKFEYVYDEEKRVFDIKLGTSSTKENNISHVGKISLLDVYVNGGISNIMNDIINEFSMLSGIFNINTPKQYEEMIKTNKAYESVPKYHSYYNFNQEVRSKSTNPKDRIILSKLPSKEIMYNIYDDFKMNNLDGNMFEMYLDELRKIENNIIYDCRITGSTCSQITRTGKTSSSFTYEDLSKSIEDATKFIEGNKNSYFNDWYPEGNQLKNSRIINKINANDPLVNFSVMAWKKYDTKIKKTNDLVNARILAFLQELQDVGVLTEQRASNHSSRMINKFNTIKENAYNKYLENYNRLRTTALSDINLQKEKVWTVKYKSLTNVDDVSTDLNQFQQNIPRDFQTKPLSMSDIVSSPVESIKNITMSLMGMFYYIFDWLIYIIGSIILYIFTFIMKYIFGIYVSMIIPMAMIMNILGLYFALLIKYPYGGGSEIYKTAFKRFAIIGLSPLGFIFSIWLYSIAIHLALLFDTPGYRSRSVLIQILILGVPFYMFKLFKTGILEPLIGSTVGNDRLADLAQQRVKTGRATTIVAPRVGVATAGRKYGFDRLKGSFSGSGGNNPNGNGNVGNVARNPAQNLSNLTNGNGGGGQSPNLSGYQSQNSSSSFGTSGINTGANGINIDSMGMNNETSSGTGGGMNNPSRTRSMNNAMNGVNDNLNVTDEKRKDIMENLRKSSDAMFGKK